MIGGGMKEIDAEELDSLKKWLQGLFTDDLVIVIGSGLSCAEGLPGMGALAIKLKDEVPKYLDDSDKNMWEEIASSLDSDGLEGALLKHQANERVESAIIETTAKYILQEEQKIINECINNNRKLKFSYLLPYISPANPQIARVITTNYDRLIEFAAEYEDWGVDSMMVGRYWGKHNPELSAVLLAEKVVQQKGNIKLQHRKHIKIFKPHGSLDWFMIGDIPMSSCFGNISKPLIITPGMGKYQKGYSQPFDVHRDKGNQIIDKASTILCIGYGFNDDHLQTHLTSKMKSGAKTLLLTRGLSDSARRILKESSNCIALVSNDNPSGTLMVDKDKETLISEVQWWDIEYFVKEVLENGK